MIKGKILKLFTIFLQTLTAGESIDYVNIEHVLTITEDDIDRMQELRSNNQDEMAKRFPSRFEKVDHINDTAKFVPWFLECNVKRYPYWFGAKDPRNKLLHEALQKISMILKE